MNLVWLAARWAGLVGLVTMRTACDMLTTVPLGAELRAGSRHLRAATRSLSRGLRAARPGT